MKKFFLLMKVGLVMVILLTGCGGNVEVTPVPPTATMEVVPPTDMPVPTEPEPVPSGVVVLVDPGDVNPEKIQELEVAGGAAASARGFIFEKRGEITIQTAPENLVMVVSAADFAGLAEMADAMPDVLFVVAGPSVVEAKPNLTVMGEDEDLSLRQAFMAGYIAAVMSDEYRIGIISMNDAAGQDYRKAFLNGAIYFCGNCATIYPPFEPYPVFQEVAPGADQAALENAAQTLIGRGVNMMLVAPGFEDGGFYQFLAQNGVRIIGTDAPPEGLESYWVASVMLTPVYGLETTLGAILDQGILPISGSKVEISYTGAGEARLTHFLQILDQLNSGAIDPLGKID